MLRGREVFSGFVRHSSLFVWNEQKAGKGRTFEKVLGLSSDSRTKSSELVTIQMYIVDSHNLYTGFSVALFNTSIILG